jgi:hypothetical protein
MKYDYELNKFEEYLVQLGSVDWLNSIDAVGRKNNMELKESDLVNLYDFSNEVEKSIITKARNRSVNRLCPILTRERYNSYGLSILYYYLKTDVDMLLENTKNFHRNTELIDI